jgi:beta-N-acetylhexosaminidase
MSPWVQKTLASLSLDEKLGQLLHPNIRPHWTEEELKKALPPVRLGGAFIFSGPGSEFVRVTRLLQSGTGVPLVISTDLESGAGRMISGATSFPDLMSLAAADDVELARRMGEATAVEARAYGVHWTFGPVVDVNMNPANPITNTRGLGDDPQKIARLATALVESMQAHGLAATVKHFPGDGWDDRDQHLATTINPLSAKEWNKTSGIPYRETFAAGCWTTMIGHIAMPSIDPGHPRDPLGPPPATQSRRITTDFLRGKLGFDGLVISDAIEMNGSVSRVQSAYELVVNMVNAGNDMLLFCDAKRDFAILQKAVGRGDITLERVEDACARVLELKERLGFAADPASALPAADPEAVLAPHRERFADAARTLARRALTPVQSLGKPLTLKKGSQVLVLHLRSNAEYHTDAFDDLLRGHGIEVVRRTEADTPFEYRSIDYSNYAMVLVLWTVGPTWGTSFIRPAGAWMRGPWFVRHEYPACPIVHVSFGTPYLIHDVPWADTMLNAYSPDAFTQQAVAEWLFGELKPTGTSPVDLKRHEKVRALIAKKWGKGKH